MEDSSKEDDNDEVDDDDEDDDNDDNDDDDDDDDDDNDDNDDNGDDNGDDDDDDDDNNDDDDDADDKKDDSSKDADANSKDVDSEDVDHSKDNDVGSDHDDGSDDDEEDIDYKDDDVAKMSVEDNKDDNENDLEVNCGGGDEEDGYDTFDVNVDPSSNDDGDGNLVITARSNNREFLSTNSLFITFSGSSNNMDEHSQSNSSSRASSLSLVSQEQQREVTAAPVSFPQETPLIRSWPCPKITTMQLLPYRYNAQNAPAPQQDSVLTFETMDTIGKVHLDPEPFVSKGIVSLQSYVKHGRGILWQNHSACKLHYKTDMENWRNTIVPKARHLQIPHHTFHPNGGQLHKIVRGNNEIVMLPRSDSRYLYTCPQYHTQTGCWYKR